MWKKIHVQIYKRYKHLIQAFEAEIQAFEAVGENYIQVIFYLKIPDSVFLTVY